MAIKVEAGVIGTKGDEAARPGVADCLAGAPRSVKSKGWAAGDAGTGGMMNDQ